MVVAKATAMMVISIAGIVNMTSLVGFAEFLIVLLSLVANKDGIYVDNPMDNY